MWWTPAESARCCGSGPGCSARECPRSGELVSTPPAGPSGPETVWFVRRVDLGVREGDVAGFGHAGSHGSHAGEREHVRGCSRRGGRLQLGPGGPLGPVRARWCIGCGCLWGELGSGDAEQLGDGGEGDAKAAADADDGEAGGVAVEVAVGCVVRGGAADAQHAGGFGDGEHGGGRPLGPDGASGSERGQVMGVHAALSPVGRAVCEPGLSEVGGQSRRGAASAPRWGLALRAPLLGIIGATAAVRRTLPSPRPGCRGSGQRALQLCGSGLRLLQNQVAAVDGARGRAKEAFEAERGAASTGSGARLVAAERLSRHFGVSPHTETQRHSQRRWFSVLMQGGWHRSLRWRSSRPSDRSGANRRPGTYSRCCPSGGGRDG